MYSCTKTHIRGEEESHVLVFNLPDWCCEAQGRLVRPDACCALDVSVTSISRAVSRFFVRFVTDIVSPHGSSQNNFVNLPKDCPRVGPHFWCQPDVVRLVFQLNPSRPLTDSNVQVTKDARLVFCFSFCVWTFWSFVSTAHDGTKALFSSKKLHNVYVEQSQDVHHQQPQPSILVVPTVRRQAKC